MYKYGVKPCKCGGVQLPSGDPFSSSIKLSQCISNLLARDLIISCFIALQASSTLAFWYKNILPNNCPVSLIIELQGVIFTCEFGFLAF